MGKFIDDTLDQSIYDAYNKFIFSKDRGLFAKLASKLFFLEKTKNIPGDIVELGVFKGSGVMCWLKANELTSINQKKVYGFDIFNQEQLVKSINTQDSSLMESLFKDRNFESIGYQEILNKIVFDAGFSNLNLISGNVFETIPDFLNKNPGFRASIINFDLDTYEPTLFCLQKLWDRLVLGGIMIFDEYGFNQWTESQAVDEFIAEKKLKIKTTIYKAPSAYLIKENM